MEGERERDININKKKMCTEINNRYDGDRMRAAAPWLQYRTEIRTKIVTDPARARAISDTVERSCICVKRPSP